MDQRSNFTGRVATISQIKNDQNADFKIIPAKEGGYFWACGALQGPCSSKLQAQADFTDPVLSELEDGTLMLHNRAQDKEGTFTL